MSIKHIKWRIVFSLVLHKLTDILLSAKTTLPTLMNAIGAPSWMLSFLVPIRESGSLLPQALLSVWLSNKANRLKPLLISILLQILFILMTLLFLPMFYPDKPIFSGGIVLAALIGFSLSKSLSSLTMKDVQGGHLPKGERGQVVGIASLFAGALTLAFALFTFLFEKMNDNILMLIGILCCTAMTVSSVNLLQLKTSVDITKSKSDQRVQKSNLLLNLRKYLSSFKGEIGDFVLVRACFVHTALIAPFYIVWSTNSIAQNGFITLSSFIVAQASATMLSAYIWGTLSDINAKLTMQLGAMLVLIVAITLVIINQFGLLNVLHPLYFVLFYFLICVGHEGARSGRKVYALDIKKGADRTDFIGKANTAIGIAIILLGVFYSVLSMLGETTLFAVMSMGLTIGLFFSFSMKPEK